MKVNPFWGKWAIYDGKTRRPAAYKTGTTSDNRDVAAYGYLAPPADKKAPALAVGVWMGNSDNTPNDGKLSLDTSAPLWSAILTEVSKGEKIAKFKPPADIVTAKVDAFTGLKPGPFTTKTVNEYFVPGTVPTQKETSGRRSPSMPRAACFDSMTWEERNDHRILNANRRRRIARGSGTTVASVNQLIKQYTEMRQMMRQLIKLRDFLAGRTQEQDDEKDDWYAGHEWFWW